MATMVIYSASVYDAWLSILIMLGVFVNLLQVKFPLHTVRYLQKLCTVTVFFCILIQSNDCKPSINP